MGFEPNFDFDDPGDCQDCATCQGVLTYVGLFLCLGFICTLIAACKEKEKAKKFMLGAFILAVIFAIVLLLLSYACPTSSSTSGTPTSAP